jgi:hypothetical protein
MYELTNPKQAGIAPNTTQEKSDMQHETGCQQLVIVCAITSHQHYRTHPAAHGIKYAAEIIVTRYCVHNGR